MAQKKKLVGLNVIKIINALFKNLHRNKVLYASFSFGRNVCVSREMVHQIWHTVAWMQVRSIIFCQNVATMHHLVDGLEYYTSYQ